MPITQMPLRGVGSSPPQNENDLYDGRRWETAYRELHATPTLLIQLQDDLSRSRLREAFWISVIVHLVVLMAIVESDTLARWFPLDKWFPRHSALLVTPASPRDKELTYLELPPDAEKPTRRPNSDIISDKDRVAMSKRPHLDPEELRKILGRPSAPSAPQVPPAQNAQPSPPPVAAQNAPPPAQEQPRPPVATENDNQTAKLKAPPRPFGAPMSASSSLDQAIRGVASNRGGGYGGAGADYGFGQGRQPTKAVGSLDVLSDTMGVDFGPYLNRVLHEVRENWYRLIPESAQWKKGKLSIQFAILKDGRVAGLKLAASSGDTALDRPAWGSITDSNPFPPLPSEFGGQYLALQFHFFYNPDKSELE